MDKAQNNLIYQIKDKPPFFSTLVFALHLFETTTAGRGLMHEGFHKDDPELFTRAWFAWANSIFAEFVIHAASR